MRRLVFVFLASTLLLAVLSQGITCGSDPELTERLLPTFYRVADVLGLDLSKFNVTVASAYLNPVEIFYPHRNVDLDVRLTLKGDGLNLSVSSFFVEVEGKLRLIDFMLFVDGDSSRLPEVMRVYPHVRDCILDVLERYRDAFGKSYVDRFISTIRDIPNDIDLDSSATEEWGRYLTVLDEPDLRLTITAYSWNKEGITFTWFRKFNGIISDAVLSVGVWREDPIHVEWIGDKWNLFKPGSSEVRVSRDEAVAKTLELASEYLEKYNGTVRSIEVKLSMGNYKDWGRGDPLTVYPIWNVRIEAVFRSEEARRMGLEGYAAGIWADTGEVAYARPTGHYTSIKEPNKTTQENTVETGWNPTPYLAAAAAATAAAAITTITLYKKKRKTA